MTSTLERMRRLPATFTATDALLLGEIPLDQLNRVLWRWKEAGIIRSLGSRSDIWFNLVVQPEVSRAQWELAVRRALPSAVAGGHSVLMRSGVTTQLSNSDYLIQPANTRTAAAIDGATLAVRPAIWIRRLWQLGAVQVANFPELDPGAAIVDLFKFDGGSIHEDDIDWEELSDESLRLYHHLADLVDLELESAPPSPVTRDSAPRG